MSEQFSLSDADQPAPPANCSVCCEPVDPDRPGVVQVAGLISTGRTLVNVVTCPRVFCTTIGRAVHQLVDMAGVELAAVDLHESGDCDCEKAPADAD